MSVNTSDLLCGIYLGIIWIADVSVGEYFVVREENWRLSLICFIAFGCLLCFRLLTPSVLFFMSLSRLLIVLYPMDTKFKRYDFVLRKSACLIEIFYLIQVTLLITIILAHSLLVKALKESQNNGGSAKNTLSNISYIIITTNILCWFHTDIMYIATIFISRYPVNLIAWTTVTITPVNSVINPCVFVLAAVRVLLREREISLK